MGNKQDDRHDGDVAPGRSQWLSISVVIFGVLTVVIGLVLCVLPSAPSSIGWFAYAPLAETAFIPTVDLLTPQRQIGIVLLIIGVAALFFGAGWLLGRRHAARHRLPDRGTPDA